MVNVEIEHIANLRGKPGKDGEDGAKGDPGTFDSLTVQMLPANKAPEAILSGDHHQHALLRIPRGLPGVNAVENDEAVGAYMAGRETQTRLATDAAIDQTGSELVRAGTSPLAQAVRDTIRTVGLGEPVFLGPSDLHGVTANTELTTIGETPDTFLAWRMPTDQTSTVHANVRLPGWASFRMRIFWMHNTSGASGNGRFFGAAVPFETGARPGGGVSAAVTSSAYAGRQVRESVIEAAFKPGSRNVFGIQVSRIGSSASGDTLPVPAFLLGVSLERTA